MLVDGAGEAGEELARPEFRIGERSHSSCRSFRCRGLKPAPISTSGVMTR
jgi:hypothetical protein